MTGDRRTQPAPTGRETRRVVEAIRLVEFDAGRPLEARGDGGKRGHEQISLPARLPPADRRDAASISDQRPAAPRRARARLCPAARSSPSRSTPASATSPPSTKPFAPRLAYADAISGLAALDQDALGSTCHREERSDVAIQEPRGARAINRGRCRVAGHYGNRQRSALEGMAGRQLLAGNRARTGPFSP